MKNTLKILVLLAAVVLGAGVVQAGEVYEAVLTPGDVVPGSNGHGYGRATLIVNDAETELYLTLNFDGLTSAQTGTSLLLAAPGEVGEALYELPLGRPLAETLEFDDVIVGALETDNLAIQVYSESYPGGVIRGNFVFDTVESESTSWSQVKTLFQ